MLSWFLDDLWLQPHMPWFFSLPIAYNDNNNSPINSFYDYINPLIDRFTPTSTGNNSNDYYHLYSSLSPRTDKSQNKMLKTFNNAYQTLHLIGVGGFGQVFSGRRKSDNIPVIVKILPKNRILNWSTKTAKRIPYEIEILFRLRHLSEIVQIYDYFEEPDQFIFTMEKIPNSTTLFRFVLESSSLENTELLRHIFREMIRINVVLQEYGIWHRDCKPENILFCRNDRSLRFIDFGSAAPATPEDFHEFQGTLEVMVPEWILQKRYNGEKACVWTLGVCLYFLLFQQYPFRTKVDIVNGRSNLPFQSSPDKAAYQTMRQCLNRNENRRPKLSQLQYLSWLN